MNGMKGGTILESVGRSGEVVGADLDFCGADEVGRCCAELLQLERLPGRC